MVTKEIYFSKLGKFLALEISGRPFEPVLKLFEENLEISDIRTLKMVLEKILNKEISPVYLEKSLSLGLDPNTIFVGERSILQMLSQNIMNFFNEVVSEDNKGQSFSALTNLNLFGKKNIKNLSEKMTTLLSYGANSILTTRENEKNVFVILKEIDVNLIRTIKPNLAESLDEILINLEESVLRENLRIHSDSINISPLKTKKRI